MIKKYAELGLKMLGAFYYIPIFILFSIVAVDNGVPNATSDPLGTMVVTQNLLENHTITLLGKYADYFRTPAGGLRYQVYQAADKIEYYFPIGTPLLLLPGVAVADWFGYDATASGGDIDGQRAAIFLVVFLIFLTTRAYIKYNLKNEAIATLAAILIFFGTIVGPTVATGLWGIDFEVLLIGLSMLLVVNEKELNIKKSVALGVILFTGYLVRPSFSLLILAIFFLLLLRKEYAKFALAAIVSGAMFICFVIWSRNHYGANLPPYYAGSRLSLEHFKEAFFALLISPSRSIFIFSPILFLLPPALYSLYSKKLITNGNYDIIVLFLACVGLFLTNALFPHWTGGWSYGPRIITDMSYIGALLVFRVKSELYSGGGILSLVRAPLLLLVVGLGVGFQGIYNQYTGAWNVYPNIDEDTSVVWDWRFPQPLMTKLLLIDKCMTQSKELQLKNYVCPK